AGIRVPGAAAAAGGGESSTQRPRLCKAWYLDAPENEASPTLLAELGIVDYAVHLEKNSPDVNVQLWKLAQARLAMHSKSGSDVMNKGAIQIGDLPATAFTHDDMEDQVLVLLLLLVFGGGVQFEIGWGIGDIRWMLIPSLLRPWHGPPSCFVALVEPRLPPHSKQMMKRAMFHPSYPLQTTLFFPAPSAECLR
ncbi:unnamed protein product, partial [Ectocarpus sp. 4 AP-2014]